MKIKAYVMTLNEQNNIKKCLNSLSWCDEVVVGDTGSLDATKEIAKNCGATVLDVSFEGFGKTRNKIIDQIDADWIICFDADEVCSEDLKKEIIASVQKGNSSALIAPRQNYLLGKKIKYSGWCPDYRHPVAFRKSDCRYSDKVLHETLNVKGETTRLNSSFDHYSYPTLTSYMEKVAKYSKLGADEVIRKNKRINMGVAAFHSVFKFIRHYFINFGFLDGWAGLTIAVASAYGTYFKYAIAYETLKNTSKD